MNQATPTTPTAPRGGRSARIPGFYKLDSEARGALLCERFALDQDDLTALMGDPPTLQLANKMVENCIGVLSLPVGLGLNFLINGREYAVPMVVEEPSVIAAVSHSARLVHGTGGFTASADRGLMIAQIQLLGIEEPAAAIAALEAETESLLAMANDAHPSLSRRGGGAREFAYRWFAEDSMLVVHLMIDCVDAMGANAVNSMAETLSPTFERLTGGRANLRIVSNLADRRCARASCAIDVTLLETPHFFGAEVADRIVDAYRFAAVDPYRAATHNKGIMNGIDAVAIATGNDWRGLEAGAHAFAARTGRYTSLSRWWHVDGKLHGEIELPMAVGTVGGSTGVHPTIRVLRKILNVDTAEELAGVMAAVGLAQNLGAIRALATDGIQRGHMTLHARSVALAAGVAAPDVQRVADEMVRRGQIGGEAARSIAGGGSVTGE